MPFTSVNKGRGSSSKTYFKILSLFTTFENCDFIKSAYGSVKQRFSATPGKYRNGRIHATWEIRWYLWEIHVKYLNVNFTGVTLIIDNYAKINVLPTCNVLKFVNEKFNSALNYHTYEQRHLSPYQVRFLVIWVL